MSDVTINLGQLDAAEFQTLRSELAFAEDKLREQQVELSRWANEATTKVQNTPEEQAEARGRAAKVTELRQRIDRLRELREKFG
jgi:hypothetical protein